MKGGLYVFSVENSQSSQQLNDMLVVKFLI